jgi:hypothetical protein
MEQKRNSSIEILKFFACILITNSHMDILYGKYNMLGTGGAIGDVLFFFCSGFTLFLGRSDRFDNWYKRRIKRIYPTVFAWAIFLSFCGISERNMNMKNLLLFGGGWFVSCIMIYYFVLYFMRKFLINKLWVAFGLSCIVVVTWYLFEERSLDYNMYGSTYFKWCHYFLFMLLGAMIGISKREIKFSLKKDFLWLILSVVTYYAILFLARKNELFSELVITSLIPLLTTTFYFYKICNAECLNKLYQSKYAGWIIKLISTLTLEIYIVQSVFISDRMTHYYFPLNIFITFVIIVAVAYCIKVISRIFSQTFNESSYEWKRIFKIIN